MAPTSDERREVAERMRKLMDGKSPMTECSVDALYTALGFPCSFGTGIECAVVGYIAELIDPDGLTCHMDEDDGEIPSSIIDNLTTWFCSGCGSPIYNDMKPMYCPYCGAEVVTDDAD